MSIAPFAASEPYNAAAAAPVITDIDSMSSGFISAMDSVVPRDPNSMLPSLVKLCIGIPSITYSTFEVCIIDFIPRIMTLAEPPTPDELVLITAPATLPARLFTKFADFTVVTASDFTCCTV